MRPPPCTLVLLFVACGSSAPPPPPYAGVCAHYAELMVRCQSDESPPALVRATADNFCQKGMSGRHEDMFGPRYRAMIECTRSAETCDALAACQDPASP